MSDASGAWDRDLMRRGATVTASGWLGVVLMVALSGGFDSPLFAWLLAVPLLGGLLGGLRAGVAWASLTAATVLILLALQQHVPLPSLLPEEHRMLPGVAQKLGLLAVVVAMVLAILRKQDRAESRARQAAEQLQREIAVRRRAEEAAQGAAQAKSEFLAMMSHELRTPMNGVLGMAQMLQQTRQTDEQRMFTETIQSSGEVLMQVLSDLLDFSRIEAGELQLEQRAFALRPCMESVAGLVARQAQQKGVALLLDLDETLPERIVADETRLRQMVLNLLANAVKFTQSGEVVLQVFQEADRLRFSVRDTGIGIPPAAQAHIFTAFTQADSSTTRRFGGTGLGLAIVRALAEAMRGEVGLSSTLGEGSTFWFTISAASPDTALPPGRSLAVLQGRRVLVVEHNATHRSLLTRQLAAWGLSVVVAASAVEALSCLREHARSGTPIELAILSREMAGAGGLQLSLEIEADPGLRGVRRLLLSSIGTQPPPPETGIFAQLHKPVRAAQLSEALLALCGEAPKPEAAPPQQEHSERDILVVEDNSVNQLVVRHFLATLGYRCTLAENGAVALELLGEQDFSAVLMDVHMPVLDGLEATRRLRADLNLALPVIGLTASAMAEDRARCLDAGMDDFLTKPLEIGALQEALERHCGPLLASRRPVLSVVQ